MNASLKEAGGARAVALPDGSLAGLALAHWPGEVALLRTDLRVEWINERFAARIGLEPAECIGLEWLALHPTAAVHAAEYQRAVRGAGLELPAFPAQGPDRLGFYCTTLQPLQRDGQIVGVLVIEREVSADADGPPAAAHDVTVRRLTAAERDSALESERRRIEDALAHSREQFRRALECAQIGFYEWDVVADTLTGLDDWCASRGVPPERGRPGHDLRWETLVHPDDIEALRLSLTDHLRGESEFAEVEYRMRTDDGRWIWVFDRSQISQRLPDGRPQRIAGVCMQIDRRRRAELALRETELRLAAAVWGAGIGMWEMDMTGAGARWFSDWCETEDLHACEGPDHVANWDAHIHSDDLPRAAALFSDLTEGRGDVYESEYRIRTRSGRWVWIFERGRATERGADGRPRRIVGICMNIQARKEAEHALRESQLRLRAIAENSTDWLLLVDTRQQIVFANRPVLGIPPEQLAGRPLGDFSPPHDREATRRFIAGVLAGDDPQPQREQVIGDLAEGPRVMLMRARPVHGGEAIVGVVLTITEITRQRRDERMLRLQARILETMREGVVLVDAHNGIRLTNPAFDELFGYAPDELGGRSIEELFRIGDAAPRGKERRLRAQLADAPVELECLRRDGSSFTAGCVVTPLVIDGADHWLAVINDVSERKLLERQILEVSNREQQRIGNDLHDGLGQELTGVALMLRGLTMRIRRSHPEALREVDEIVDLLNQSIHNARTLARGLSPVSLERGGLVPALRTLAVRARETYGLATTLRTRLSHPLRLDESAASHLYRIVQEALSNAMRHGRASRVRIQLSADDVAIRLSVHDNGRGLPPEVQRSSGLGLRTMRYRAQVVGGDLLVANHRLGGTIVRCVCPQGARERVSLSHAHARAHVRAHALPTTARRKPHKKPTA